MSAFFQDYEKFYGTGNKDENGYSLGEYLEKYDTSAYETPSNTVDTLVFSYENTENDEEKKLLLIKRRNHPSIGWFALPGGFVEMKENLHDAALRELKEETGVDNIDTEQLMTYGDYKRDPRTRVITTAYVALVKESDLKVCAGDDAADAGWFNISEELISKDEEVCNGKTIIKEMHKLNLWDNKGNKAVSTVLVKYNKEGILKNRTYTAVDSDMLAADHGAIILNGYDRIRGII